MSSKNQSRIHPLPSQSDNNYNFEPPPPPRPLPSPSHGRICNTIWNCLGGMIIVLALGLLYMLHLIKTSGSVSFNVVNTSLTQFDLNTNKNTTRLHYNLTVYINVTNINKNFIGIVYDEIEARAFYQGNRFDSINLMPFYQHKKNRPTTLHAVFQGQALIPKHGKYSKHDRFTIQKKLRDRFNRDKRHGNCFDIQVQIDLRIRYNLGRILKHVDQDNPTVKCDVRRVPLFNLSSSSIMNGSSNINPHPLNIGTSTTTVGGGGGGGGGSYQFQTKKCEVTYDDS